MKKYILGLLFTSSVVTAGHIPSGKNAPLYFRIGGGGDILRPAVNNVERYPLKYGLDISSGISCGNFDPKYTMSNSMNNFKDSAYNLGQSIITQAKAGAAALPMYILNRANPNLYNILNNTILGANEQLKVSTKSCELIEQQIAQGQNPIDNWKFLSTRTNWAAKSSSLQQSDKDINKAKADIDKLQGENGIPWLNKNAGGKGQTPIYVIKDTVQAGYNVLLDRDVSSTASAPNRPEYERLRNYWSTPKIAGEWIAGVTGDQKIVTHNEGEKDSTPGLGLLPANQHLTVEITNKLFALVYGSESITEQALKEVSAPQIYINSQIIQMIAAMDENRRINTVNKLAQDIAIAITTDQALLAKRILEMGAQVPAILASEPAQHAIRHSIRLITNEIEDITFNINIRRQLVSNTLNELIAEQAAEQINAMNNPRYDEGKTLQMQDGAFIHDRGA